MQISRQPAKTAGISSTPNVEPVEEDYVSGAIPRSARLRTPIITSTRPESCVDALDQRRGVRRCSARADLLRCSSGHTLPESGTLVEITNE